MDLLTGGSVGALLTLLTAVLVRAWKTPEDKAQSIRIRSEEDAKSFEKNARALLKGLAEESRKEEQRLQEAIKNAEKSKQD